MPEAVPDLPLDVLQVTEATPTLSDAFPVTVMEAEYAETIVEPGETMVSVGGTLSVPVPGVEGG